MINKLNSLFTILLILIFSISNFAQNFENSIVPKEFSNCDVAKMITNRLNQKKDWSLTIDETLNDFLKIIQGTSQINKFEKINIDLFKKSMEKTMPEYYSFILTNSYCQAINDGKLLRLIYCNVSGYYLTNLEKKYLEENYNDALIDQIHIKGQELKSKTIDGYVITLLDEYKKLSGLK